MTLSTTFESLYNINYGVPTGRSGKKEEKNKGHCAESSNFLKIEVLTAETGRHNWELQPPCPFLPWLQSYRFLDCCPINTNHLFVFLIANVYHCFWFLLPRIPHHCSRKTNWDKMKTITVIPINYMHASQSTDTSNNYQEFYFLLLYVNCDGYTSSNVLQLTSIWKPFLSYYVCPLFFVV